MGMFTQCKSALVGSVFFVVCGCAAAQCSPERVAEFSITNWKNNLPRTGVIEKYKAKSSFSKKEVLDVGRFVVGLEKSGQQSQTLRVEFEDTGMDINYDYILILDGKTRFNISEIKSTNMKRWGCPLESARVNACVATQSRGFVFDAACGEAVGY